MRVEDITDKYLNDVISRCDGRDWVDTGNTTRNHDAMFKRTKEYLKEPRLMLEHGPVDIWGQHWYGGWDRISNMISYYRGIGDNISQLLMKLAFDNATEEELKDFSLYAFFQVVREEAARRYGELHKELRYLPSRIEGGYSKNPMWVAAD